MTSSVVDHDPMQAAIDEARGRAPGPDFEPVMVATAIELENDNLSASRALVILALNQLIEQGHLIAVDVAPTQSSAP
jgi:hypothetical protein